MQEKVEIPAVDDYAACPIHGCQIHTADGYVNVLICDYCGEIVKYEGCEECEDVQAECKVCKKRFCRLCGNINGSVCNKCSPAKTQRCDPFKTDIDYKEPGGPEKDEEVEVVYPDNVPVVIEDDGSNEISIEHEIDAFEDLDPSDFDLGDTDFDIDSGDYDMGVDSDMDIDYDFGD